MGAPSGMQPPELTPESTSSVLVEWEKPLNENGVIQNYTIVVEGKNEKDKQELEFGSSTFSFKVLGLRSYTSYDFHVKVCSSAGCASSESVSARTLAGQPSGMKKPKVVLTDPERQALEISWKDPSDPNGEIKEFIVYRKKTSDDEGEFKQVANLTTNSYTDDKGLEPYTSYQYQIEAINQVDLSTKSPWSASTRTGQAPPEGVPHPTFSMVGATEVKVEVGNPLKSNGVLRKFVEWREKGVRGPEEWFKQVYGTSVLIIGLKPRTTYDVWVEMCTESCTTSATSTVTTKPAAPSNQPAPTSSDISSREILLKWRYPEKTNGGEIRRYEVEVCKDAPECGETSVEYSGKSLNATIDNLEPHTKYKFRITSFNSYGSCESEWSEYKTDKEEPLFVEPLRIIGNISRINVDWSKSFEVNSDVVTYQLIDNYDVTYTGFDTSYSIRRTSSMKHILQVVLFTDTGRSETPQVQYDPVSSQITLIEDTIDEVTTAVDDVTKHPPVYERLWFVSIVGVSSVAVSLMLIAIVFRRSYNYDDVNSDSTSGSSGSIRNQRTPLRYDGRLRHRGVTSSSSEKSAEDFDDIRNKQRRGLGDRVIEEPRMSEMTERNISEWNRGIDNQSYIPSSRNLSNQKRKK